MQPRESWEGTVLGGLERGRKAERVGGSCARGLGIRWPRARRAHGAARQSPTSPIHWAARRPTPPENVPRRAEQTPALRDSPLGALRA